MPYHVNNRQTPPGIPRENAPVPRPLKQAFWWSRWGWVLAFLFFSFWAGFGFVSNQLPLEAGLPLAGALIALTVYICRSILNGIRRTAEVMAATPGSEAFLNPLGTLDHTGAYVELRFDSPDPNQARRAAAVLKVGRFKPLPSGLVKALVYFEAVSPDRFIVVEADGRIYWGRLADREFRQRAWRSFRLFYLALTVALLILLTFLALEQINDRTFALEQVEAAEASLSWSKTSALVLESELVPVAVGNGRLPIDALELRVVFQYKTDGEVHEGSRIGFCTQPEKNERRAREKADLYARGRTVDVYYNPVNPEEAALEPGGAETCRKKAEVGEIGLIVVSIGALVGVAALLTGWLHLSRKRKRIFKND